MSTCDSPTFFIYGLFCTKCFEALCIVNLSDEIDKKMFKVTTSTKCPRVIRINIFQLQINVKRRID